MPTVLPLALAYDQHVRPAWTLRDTIQLETRYVRQTSGAAHFAIITMRFEPSTMDAAVRFIDDAHLSDEDMAYFYEGDRTHYPRAIADGLAQALNELHQQQRTLVAMTITLTHFHVHPIDSNERSFRIAGHLCVQELLAQAALVHVD